jgi:hypothetical protein
MIAFAWIGAFVALAAFSVCLHALRLRRHAGLSRADFVAHFAAAGVVPEVSAAVYDHFRRLGIWRSFSPSPSDRLDDTYKTVDEDVMQNLQQILDALGFEMPNSRILGQWKCPVQTLADVVNWVNWVKATEKRSA